MNLFLALFWLICTALLLAYEHFVGVRRFRVHVGGYSFSYAWFMLVLVLYNLKRWHYERSRRDKQRVLEVARAWDRRRHSTTPPGPPDPNLNFTDEPPPPPSRGFTDRPPSNN